MSRGIVMENGKRHVIVMMPDGQFRKVPTDKQPKIGEEITFSEHARPRSRPRILYSFSIGAAAAMLLLCIPLFMKERPADSQVVAYLTMDINPSIELGVNKDERVEELHAINKDGADVTADLTYKGLPVNQVAEAIMERVEAGHYIKDGEGDVIITSVLVNEDHQPAYEKDLKEHVDAAVRKALTKTDHAASQHVEVTTLSAPKELREEAKADGLSSGKMAFYLLAKSKGHQVTIHELKTHSIHQTAKAWGGVKSVIDNSKSDDAAAQKKEDTQKEQLKRLLSEEKKLKDAKKQERDRRKQERKSEKEKEKDKDIPKKEQSSNGKQQSAKTNPTQDQADKAGGIKRGNEIIDKNSEDKRDYQDDKNDDQKNNNEREGSRSNNEKDNAKVEGRNQNSAQSPSSADKEKSKLRDHSSDKKKSKRDDSRRDESKKNDSKRNIPRSSSQIVKIIKG
ncbi:anti-sigma factor domain-containing protein [Paenibacillus solisilvae]|uniref:Anti-sigma factor domain-containing protein n=1 Tax=Paenibacillus solisilvae TaxID=2486751 RepID=A0ABW0VRQ6_9BACL